MARSAGHVRGRAERRVRGRAHGGAVKVGEIEEKNAHARRVSFATRHLATRLKTVKSARLEECDPKSVFSKSAEQFSSFLVLENSERRTRVVDHTDERARVVVRRVRRRVGVTGSTRRRVPSEAGARARTRRARGRARERRGHRVSPTRFGSAGVEERNGRQHPPGRGGRPRLRRVEPSNRRASVHAVSRLPSTAAAAVSAASASATRRRSTPAPASYGEKLERGLRDAKRRAASASAWTKREARRRDPELHDERTGERLPTRCDYQEAQALGLTEKLKTANECSRRLGLATRYRAVVSENRGVHVEARARLEKENDDENASGEKKKPQNRRERA